MKFLILLVCLGFVAADLRKRAAPLVDDAVLAFKEGMGETGSLRRALGMPDAVELDEVEDEIKEELTKKIKEKLDALMEKIKETIDAKKEVATALWEKLKEYRDKLNDLKESIGDKMKEKLKDIKEKLKDKLNDVLKKILEKLDKRNLDEEYDRLARSKFSDLTEKIKAEILSDENIHKIREYIRNFVTNHPVLKAFKEFVLKLKDIDFKQLIRDLFEHRRVQSRKEGGLWDRVIDWFKKLHEKMKETHENFKAWLKEKMDAGFEKLKEKYGFLKALGLEVLSHIKEIHGEAAREALEFFREYKDDMGTLWDKLHEKLKENIGNF